MYIEAELANELEREFKGDLAAQINEKSEFMLSLLKEDDWSMIIKSHALIESVITNLIISRIEEPNMKQLIERLPLFDEAIGKVRIASDYDLIDKRDKTFLRKFSELRNQLVHKFENVNFELKNHVAEFDRQQRISWKRAFTWYENDEKEKNNWLVATIERPHIAIWFAAYMFVVHKSVDVSGYQSKTKLKLATEKTMKRLMSNKV